MPIQRQSAVTIDTPTSLEPESNDNKVLFPVMQACDNASLHETVDSSNLALTEQNYAKKDQRNSLVESEHDSIDDDGLSSNDDRDASDVKAPPLPITPPPPKTPIQNQDSILSLFDPLDNQKDEEPQTLSLDQNSHDYPVFNRSTSYTSDDDQIVLPSIPDSYMPRWSRQHSEPSVDLDLLQFELMTDEQDHLPSSVLPDTPQPASLATTITDYEASEPDTEYDYDQALNEQLDMLRNNSDDSKQQAAFNPSSNSTSKRNSWNTTSSFVYDNDNDDMDSLQRDDLDQNWSENTPSVIAVPAKNRKDDDNNNNNEDDSDEFRKSPRRSRNSRVMSIAAMFEANTTPTSSTNSSLERQKANETQRSTESLAKKPLVRRPTAMEILATPSAHPPKNDEEDDDIDLKKLRRSIVRGARSAVGLKTDPEALLNDPKIKRSTSLSPMDMQQSKGTSASRTRNNRPRPRSLIMQQDVEASF